VIDHDMSADFKDGAAVRLMKDYTHVAGAIDDGVVVTQPYRFLLTNDGIGLYLTHVIVARGT